MVIKSIQKVIKVGDSLAVTIPSRDAKAAGLKPGKEVSISVKDINPAAKKPLSLDKEYKAFKKQYSQTLKNLSNR